jgi:hypothetical protein
LGARGFPREFLREFSLRQTPNQVREFLREFWHGF